MLAGATGFVSMNKWRNMAELEAMRRTTWMLRDVRKFQSIFPGMGRRWEGGNFGDMMRPRLVRVFLGIRE